MKNSRNRTTATAIAIFLALTIAVTLVALPTVNAADVKTYAYLAVEPNPVQVGQQVWVSLWVSPVQPTAFDFMHGFIVNITKPDGTTETKGPLTSYPHGSQFFVYTPSTVGNYTFQFSYPGETFSSTGDHYMASESPITTLVCQSEPIFSLPETPLPTGYWTRPINSENRLWNTISGDWLMANYNATNVGFSDAVSGCNPYSQAPRSPHVVWTKELGLGGLTGGQYGSTGYYTGQSYSPYFTPPIIMNGRLYYRTFQSLWGAQVYPGFVCVDLRTGQELWENDNGNIDVGQLWNIEYPTGKGVIPFLWGTTSTTWNVYDPFTGHLLFSFANAISSTTYSPWNRYPIVYADDGTMLVYLLDGADNWFAMWNSTEAFLENGLIWSYPPGTGVWEYAPGAPGTYDWSLGIQWNVTIPEHHFDTTMGLAFPVTAGIADNVLVADVSNMVSGGIEAFMELGYDMTTGQEIWARNTTVATFFTAFGSGIYADFDLATMRWTGYDITTGEQLWVSDPNEYPWGSYVNYAPIIANGKLYSGSFDGYVHVFDIKTGKQLWKFSSGNAGTETTVGTWPFWNGPIIADGVVFAGTGQETPAQPLTRGNKVFAIDDQTGKEIWSISGYMSLRAIADGYLLGYNGYDTCIYCFGKGQTATTVEAPMTAITAADSVVIQGTVTDQSPGATGTPAIADEYMTPWMEYLYMQQPCPTNATGVEVTLDAIDPNGNYIHIGNTTSDAYGNFGYAWTTPDIPGKYAIIATFAGSESYYASYAETYAVVSQAPAATPTPTPAADTTMTIIGTGVGTGIAVIIAIAIAVVLILRKK
jgi:outer membrane protein assembly factor BamB